MFKDVLSRRGRQEVGILLETRLISKRFNGFSALRGLISPSGRGHPRVIGPNGAGKTTLFNL